METTCDEHQNHSTPNKSPRNLRRAQSELGLELLRHQGLWPRPPLVAVDDYTAVCRLYESSQESVELRDIRGCLLLRGLEEASPLLVREKSKSTRLRLGTSFRWRCVAYSQSIYSISH